MKMVLDWQNISRQGAHQGITRMHTHHRGLLQAVVPASQVYEPIIHRWATEISTTRYLIRYPEGGTGQNGSCSAVDIGLKSLKGRLQSPV
jgi:hypothetical protein